MKFLIVIFLFSIFIGCSTKTIKSTNTKFPSGQKLYLSKCSGCHRLYDRLEYTPHQWDSIMVVMRVKAKTNPEQEIEILNYLKERN
ncbi:MAG: hypothetical protein N3F03_06670 [Ignavibacteria bacterium]|nr:hypothetical protein [Ignavibacteria bacterium]